MAGGVKEGEEIEKVNGEKEGEEREEEEEEGGGGGEEMSSVGEKEQEA